jgi:hypothetical protein
MDRIKANKWIKIIAVFILVGTLLALIYHVLVLTGTIDDEFSLVDNITFVIDTVAGIIIFIGLWKQTSWGWKFTIFYMLISWIYFSYDLLADYERFVSIVMTPLSLIEAAILRFLLSSDVREYFKVGSSPFHHFNWTPTAIALFAVFLLVNDFFDGYIAFFTIIALLLGFRASKKYKKKLEMGYNKSVQ